MTFNDETVQIWNGTSWVDITTRNHTYTHNDTARSKATIIVPKQSELDSFTGDEELRIIDDSLTPVVLFGGFLSDLGEIDEEGKVTLEVDGYGYEIGEGEVTLDFSDSSTTDKIILEQTLTGTDYEGNVSFPADATEISISDYSAIKRRKDVWRELKNSFGRRILFMPDKTVRYEPVGHFDSSETINTSTDNAKIKKWKRNITKYQINKVTVFGSDTNGNEVIHTETTGAGDKSKSIKISFPLTSSLAEEIAQDNIDTSTRDKGKIKVFRYKPDLVNQAIEIIDSKRGINDSFVIKRQTNYFPERVTVFEVSLVDEEIAIEEASKEQQDLLDERSSLFLSDSEDVGNQPINDNTNNDNADISEDNRAPDVNGDTTLSDIDGAYNFNSDIDTSTGNPNFTVSAPNISGGVDYTIISVTLSVNREGSATSDTGFDVTIENLDTNTILFDERVCENEESFSVTIQDPDASGFDDYAITATRNTSNDWTAKLYGVVQSLQTHEHSGVNAGGTLFADQHVHLVADDGHLHAIDSTTGEKILSFTILNQKNR